MAGKPKPPPVEIEETFINKDGNRAVRVVGTEEEDEEEIKRKKDEWVARRRGSDRTDPTRNVPCGVRHLGWLVDADFEKGERGPTQGYEEKMRWMKDVGTVKDKCLQDWMKGEVLRMQYRESIPSR